MRSKAAPLLLLLAWNNVMTCGESAPVIRVSDGILRQLARQQEPPSYPAASFHKGVVGVAVADIDVDPNGTVSFVNVLEAPDDAITRSLASTLRRWTFSPATVRGKPVRMRGKLIYYFRIVNGERCVLKPGEAVAQ